MTESPDAVDAVPVAKGKSGGAANELNPHMLPNELQPARQEQKSQTVPASAINAGQAASAGYEQSASIGVTYKPAHRAGKSS